MRSPSASCSRFTSALPLAARDSSGSSKTFSQCTRPLFVKQSRYACVDATKTLFDEILVGGRGRDLALAAAPLRAVVARERGASRSRDA